MFSKKSLVNTNLLSKEYLQNTATADIICNKSDQTFEIYFNTVASNPTFSRLNFPVQFFHVQDITNPSFN